MSSLATTSCAPRNLLLHIGYLAAGFVSGVAVWFVCIMVLWPLAGWAFLYGPLLALTIWLIGGSIWAFRVRRRDPRHATFLAGMGITPVFYSALMLYAASVL